jgi:hypothetical protein
MDIFITHNPKEAGSNERRQNEKCQREGERMCRVCVCVCVCASENNEFTAKNVEIMRDDIERYFASKS